MKEFNAVVAPRNGGKTSFLRKLDGAKGILTLSSDKSKNQLYLHDIATGEEVNFMNRVDGKYIIQKNAFAWGEERLLKLDSGIVVVDECGLIELERREGFFNSIVKLSEKEISLFVSVRDSFLDLFLSVFPYHWNVIRP